MNQKSFTSLFWVMTLLTIVSFRPINANYTITAEVVNLRNNEGVVQFTLYNKEGSIPDEHFEKYYLQLQASVLNSGSKVTFKNLPKGDYAINILHDENMDGKIEKGWILPTEGIGFSNLSSINPLNRPSFKKAKFELKKDTSIQVKIIYM